MLEEEEYADGESLFEQEFSEQDVLPFLLQAQDIISKLESRVVELESDLSVSTIHRKYEHDRHDWLVGLSQKDQYINHLSGKLERSEFNTKETIVLLSELATDDIDGEAIKSTITLCLNYLRQQTDAPLKEEDDLEEGELERRQAAVTQWRRRKSSADIPDHSSITNTTTTPTFKSCDQHAVNNNNNNNNSLDGLSSLCSSSSLSSLSHDVVEPTFLINNDDDTDSFCINCKQLLTQLDGQIEQKAYLKRDLNSLASALSEEEEIRSTIEQDKEALEIDVGDITSSLFSSLNHILMDEVTDRDGLVQIHRETGGKLTSVLDAWDTRDNRLKQLKDLLIQLDSVVHQSANGSCTLAHRYSQPQPIVSRLANRISHPLRFSSIDLSPKPSNTNTVRIDGFILTEFTDHLKIVTDTSTTIPPTLFMKRVLLEDIEPCLFFPQSQGWWKSPWFKKKLIDAISRNKCEIQGWHDSHHNSSVFSNYTNTTNSSSSVTTSPATSHCSSQQSLPPMAPKTKCACCNLLRVCEYKMRLPMPNTSNKLKKVNTVQPWLPIDRFCRDRLVAVCGFYSFMSHLKLMMSTPTLTVFKQMMHHRRKMALARVGSIGLFVEEDESDYNDIINKRLSSGGSIRQRRRNRESLVLDHSGSGSDTASIVSVSEMQGLEGQIVIVH
ncbi:hypothetical protein INT47_009340 [Mucor saturninus]|uniref:GDP/GTP exchange factor Sec2 N-terminal domain-containing protein n=1 Tax=Mucor saturninus TaxID=64648 RepID=A0A8H7R6R4_9FUNG|nr:hypothetical protein INT47_009340 [Mucor saturninus]